MKFITYKQRSGRDRDFLVKYVRIPGSELLIPKIKQGMRFDFAYDPPGDKIYMIWPEFLDDDGNVIEDDSIDISDEGVAQMWILDQATVPFHKERLLYNKKGYFVVGSAKIARTELIA